VMTHDDGGEGDDEQVDDDVKWAGKVSFGRRRCRYKCVFLSKTVSKLRFKCRCIIGICHTEEINILNKAYTKIFRGQICTLRNTELY